MRSVIAFLVMALGASAQQTSGPAFEVASVRAHKGDAVRTGPLSVSGPLIRLEGYTLYGLIIDAFDVAGTHQISLGRSVSMEELAGVQYDIVARAPGNGAPAIENVRAMLRRLLADRFKLATHVETKVMEVYEIAPGSRRPQIEPGDSTQPCSEHTALAADGRNDEQRFTNCPVSRLAEALDKVDGRPVLDRSGISGKYNFRYVAVPGYRAREHSDPLDIDPVEAVNRLGLKLVSAKAPVEMLVIDHVEKPTAN